MEGNVKRMRKEVTDGEKYLLKTHLTKDFSQNVQHANKNTVKYHCTSTRTAIIKKIDINKVDEDVMLEMLCIADGNIKKVMRILLNTIWQVP